MFGLPLSSGIKLLDEMLGGLEVGSLVLIEGDASVSSLSHIFCVRAQLSSDGGGLASSAIWLDGGNTFSPYLITEISKRLGLDPERVLSNIYISRAFTCYQMSSLVLEKLWDAVKIFGSRLVVISDLLYPYLESDIPRREALKAFAPVVEELRVSPNREDVLILVTNLEYPFESRGSQIYDSLASSSDVILKLRRKRGGIEVKLEKHPLGRRGKIVLGHEVFGLMPLDEFAGGVEDG